MVVDTNCDDREMLYDQHLQELCGIKFTFREIDVIACILHNRGEKKIASLLAISDRTVNSHVRNIMNKLGYSSRDHIIDLVEKSGKLQYFRKYYFQLVLQNAFKKQLQKISTVINRSVINCSIDFTKVSTEEKNLLQRIEQHLSLANVTLVDSKQNSDNILHHLYISNNSLSVTTEVNNSITLLFDKNPDISKFEQLKLEYIDFTNKFNYYLSILLLLRKIIANSELDRNIEEFKEEQQALKNSLDETTIERAVQRLGQDNIITSRKKIIFTMLILSIVITSSLLWVFIQKQTVESGIKEPNITEVWNLPPVLEHYTERPEIIKAIWQKFKQEGDEDDNGKKQRKTAILAGLHGLGGIGKTTLAKNATHYPQQHYSFKGWFSAETKDLLQADYVELGKKYHLFTDNMSDKQKIDLVKEWLEKQQHILLVYDNAPDMNILQEYLPNRGDIIITSRNHNLPGAIEIDVMTENEAIELLNNLMPQSIKRSKNYNIDLKTLAKALGYLPLALSQAGAYIAENALTIAEYLSLYSTEKDKLLLDKTMPAMDQHQPAYVTWDISIKKLQQQENGDNALEVLNLIACCYPENIPNKLLAQYLYGKTDNQATVKLNQLLTLLRQYSLVKASSGTVSIHRLVHSWLGSKFSKEKRLTVLQRVVEAIKTTYPWKNQTTEDTTFIKLLLPHTEILLEQIQTIANEVEYSELFSVLGDIYYVLGNYVRSKAIFEKDLYINEKLYGRNSIETAQTLHNLGRVCSYLGQYEESQGILEKALAIKQKYYGLEHIETTHTLNTLGRVYLYLGKHKESQKLLEKALAIKQKHYGLNHIQTAYTLHYLGRVYVSIGKYKESQGLLEKALVIFKEHYGFEHVQTAHILNTLGKLYLFIGKYKESQELLEQSLIIKQKHYGLEHVDIAHILDCLGRVYLSLGKYKESHALLKKALAIEQNHYGSEHIYTAYTLESLGSYYLVLGDYVKAKEILTTSYNITTRLYGGDNIFSIKATAALGNAYRLLNDSQKSKDLLEQSLMLMEKMHDYDQITIARIIGNLGLLYGQLGENNKRKEYLEKALAIFKKHLPSDNRYIEQTITSLNNKDNNKHIGYLLILFS